MPRRLYFTILIYVKEGKDAVFRSYEDQALPHLAKHGGRVECMFAPTTISGNLALPDEVHVLSFDTADGFTRYRADPEVQALASLRDASVEKAIFVQGWEMDP